MRIILLSAFALFLLLPENIQAQVTVKTGYISSSRYKDENGQYPGKGDMCFVEGNVNIPVSQKMNERNQPTLWMISAGGSYTAMNNKNLQSYIDQIINMQLSVTNIRPISKKWLLLTTVGAGVYTSSDVKLKNVLGQGGVIFIRQFKSNLSLESGYTSTEADPRGIEADGNLDGDYSDHLRQSDFTVENMTIVNNAANTTDNVDRMQDVIKIRRGAKATITNALVKGSGGTIDLIDMNDSKDAGNAASSISITHTLNFKNKLNGTLNTFTEPTTNTGADASLFTWSGYNFSSL